MTHGRNASPSEAVRQLARVERQIRRLELERDRLVREARVDRQSWQAIAVALGVSRQAAWQAHRAGAAVVAQIRDRSDLSDDEAMAVVRTTLREVRRERPV